MDGRRLVWLMGVAFVVTASFFWWVGLTIQAEVTEQAQTAGVPQLTRAEAAAAVAREDKYGLPSRLPDAPDRDIERAWHEGTADNPFPASADGVRQLFDVYAVSVRGCRSMLPDPEKEADEHLLYVTLRTEGERSVISEIHVGTGEPDRMRRFTACLAGGIRAAVFQPVEGGEQTFSAQVKMPE
jgi:hypothetical protein